MGSKTKNASSTKETLKEVVMVINQLAKELEFLTIRVKQMDESMFGGLIRSEAMINTLIKNEVIPVPDYNSSLEEIYLKVEENSQKITEELKEKHATKEPSLTGECITEVLIENDTPEAENLAEITE